MIFELEHIILRPWQDSDAEYLYKYACDPRVGPMAGWAPHTSVENSRELIRNHLSKPNIYAVIFDGQPVGSIGLTIGDNNGLPSDEAEIGYWLGVPFWGQGLIPEAVNELLRYGFEDLNLNKIWCGFFEGNEKSKRVQEKCGFTYHHTKYDVQCHQLNEVRTEYISCLTKEGWRKHRAI